MNNRIQEIAEQAGFYYTDKTGFITPAGCDLAKFAELIIQECCAEIRKQDLPIPVNSYWMNKIAERIEKIFQE